MKRVLVLISVSLMAVCAWAQGKGDPPDQAANGEMNRHHFAINPAGDATITPMPDEDWFDTSNALPSTGNVTDATVQAEVKRYVAAHGTNYSTVYEVFLPKYVPGTTKLVYSSDGSSTSCGGPGLAYCAYHSSYWNGSNYVKYSIEPYPSCSGCQVSGWTVV